MSLPVSPGLVPAELRERAQWVVFRLAWDPAKSKYTKAPYQARHPDLHAKSDDPATWASFEEAVEAVSAGQADAIAYAFAEGDPFFGLDLDDGLTDAERAEIVSLVGSYTERSVSGGLHVIGRGRLDGGGRHPQKLGVFDRGRFFVVTGEVIDGRATIEDRQAELDAVLARFLPPPTVEPTARPVQPVNLDDRDLLERACAARNGADLRMLHAGAWQGRYSSQSEADLAFCRIAAFWTGRDPARIDAWLRSSGLYRQKWDRTDYRERTIEAAIAATDDVYTTSSMTSSKLGRSTSFLVPPSRGDEDEVVVTSSSAPGTRSRAEAEAERNSWVPIDLVARAGRLPAPPAIIGLVYPGKNHLLSGESEAMKTWLMLAASADEMRAGRGVVWVDGDDVGPAALLERLRLFGADDETIASRFAYFLPDDPLSADSRAAVLAVVRERSCRLAVFDGFNPLLALHALNPNEGIDVETFYRLLDPIRKEGVAVVITDNVVKSADARGSWAIGSERKKSKADVHLGMKMIQPLVRGGIGRAKISVHKDRPGFLIRPSPGLLVIDASDGDRCSWSIEEDTSVGEEGVFRPTTLMERVSRFLEAAGEPRSRNQIEQGVTGNATYVRQAIDVLCAEGHAEEFKGERGARMVQLLRAYREADEETEASSPADGPTSSQGGGSTPPQGHAVASESTSYSDSDKPADDDYVALVAHPPTGNGYSDDDGLERLAEQAPAAPVVWCGTCEAEKRFVVRGDLAYPRCGHQPLCAPGSSEGGAA